jgi:hypothetical protein
MPRDLWWPNCAMECCSHSGCKVTWWHCQPRARAMTACAASWSAARRCSSHPQLAQRQLREVERGVPFFGAVRRHDDVVPPRPFQLGGQAQTMPAGALINHWTNSGIGTQVVHGRWPERFGVYPLVRLTRAYAKLPILAASHATSGWSETILHRSVSVRSLVPECQGVLAKLPASGGGTQRHRPPLRDPARLSDRHPAGRRHGQG